MRVILYPRVSSKKQAKEGDSIEAQINRFKSFCEENNLEVVDIYTDAKSASISPDKLDIRISNGKFIVGIALNKRPAFKRILDEVSINKFDGVVFYKWDRFSRNTVFSKIAKEYFLRKNIKLIPSDDVDEPLISDIKSSLSEEEIRKMKERVRSTRLLRFSKGIMVGRCPIGYKFDKKKNVVIDEKKASIIRDVFEMTSEGVGYREICKKHKLKPQSYYNIIKNKVYIGIISFEGTEKVGIHKPLISKELFEKCNEKTN